MKSSDQGATKQLQERVCLSVYPSIHYFLALLRDHGVGGEIQAYIRRDLEEIATEGFFTEMESLEYVLTHRQLLPQDFLFVAAVCSSIFKSMLQILKITIFLKRF